MIQIIRRVAVFVVRQQLSSAVPPPRCHQLLRLVQGVARGHLGRWGRRVRTDRQPHIDGLAAVMRHHHGLTQRLVDGRDDPSDIVLSYLAVAIQVVQRE